MAETRARALLDKAGSTARFLASRFPRLTVDQVETACTDAVLDLLSRQGGDDAGMEESRFLRIAAWRQLRDLAKSEMARRQREIRWALEWADGKTIDRASDYPDHIVELVRAIEAALPDDEMRVVFRLWLEEERSSQVHAEALGLNADESGSHLGEVERLRNRLAKFLRRNSEVRKAALRLLLD